MKSLVRVLVLLFAVATVQAQNWVEERTFFSQGQATPRLDGSFSRSFNKKFGALAWFQVQNGYSEAYVGPTVSPASWLQLGVGAGLEQAQHPGRIGGFIWAGKGELSAILIAEDGGSGKWYKAEANYAVNKIVGVGLITERFKGSGPRVEFVLPRTGFKLWFAPLLEKGSVNGLVGIRLALH